MPDCFVDNNSVIGHFVSSFKITFFENVVMKLVCLVLKISRNIFCDS